MSTYYVCTEPNYRSLHKTEGVSIKLHFCFSGGVIKIRFLVCLVQANCLMYRELLFWFPIFKINVK